MRFHKPAGSTDARRSRLRREVSLMIRHLASIAEIVDDFDAAVRFYRDVLGLRVEPKPDSNYADVLVDGLLHFGIWRRSHAAQITFGDVSAVDRIPLGFTVGFEVDAASAADARLAGAGAQRVQGAHTEPWGQETCRFLSPSGALCELAETPWARTLKARVEAHEA
jgi:catechol 2,3-dioxygenase-like lactoylglutathione lyase family enzyme